MADPQPLRIIMQQYLDQLTRDVETGVLEAMVLPDPAGVLVVHHHHLEVTSHVVYVTPGVPAGEVHVFHCEGVICQHPDLQPKGK